MDIYSEQQEIETANFGRPHCFLLGAGASLAAFPNGDKNGRQLPLMCNFVEILQLESLLKESGLEPPYDDFEAIYAKIVSKEENSDTANKIDAVIYDYFKGMELPDEPTLYDHLILSLREKDVIATFNWDPFLFQAASRNSHIKKPPKLFFLHGNVAIGICHDCKIKANADAYCSKCYNPLTRTKILYPVTQKNYTDDPFIKLEWDSFRHYLKNGYLFTIFGYGAPASDIEAVKLLSQAWGTPENRSLEEIELIGRVAGDELANRWSQFIHKHHYRTRDSFYKSEAAKHPRRSCEALWECLMQCRPSDGIEFPKDLNFNELYQFFTSRIEAEKV